MKLSNKDQVSSLQSFNTFCRINNMHYGCFKAQVKVLGNGECIIDEQLTCTTYYDYKIDGQYLVIIWTFNDIQMHLLGLHGSFNSAYQLFQFQNDSLIFNDSAYSIIINNPRMNK